MKLGFLLGLLGATTLMAEKPWPGVEFTEVRAYAWPGSIDLEEVIVPPMALKEGVLNREGALLKADEVKRLVSAVTGKRPQGPIAGCYSPHNAFVFYDAARRPVAFVEVCFTCLGKRIEPAGAAKAIDFEALARLFTAHQLPMGEYPDAESFIAEQKQMKAQQDAAMKELKSR